MSKKVVKNSEEPSAQSPGQELLRALAGYPTRSVHMGTHTVNSRIVLIQRDSRGRVIGSVERQEQSEFTDLIGDWLE